MLNIWIDVLLFLTFHVKLDGTAIPNTFLNMFYVVQFSNNASFQVSFLDTTEKERLQNMNAARLSFINVKAVDFESPTDLMYDNGHFDQ